MFTFNFCEQFYRSINSKKYHNFCTITITNNSSQNRQMTSSSKFNEEDWSFEFVQPDESYIEVQQQKLTKLRKKIARVTKSNNDDGIEHKNEKKSIEVHENNKFGENDSIHSENDKGKTTTKKYHVNRQSPMFFISY